MRRLKASRLLFLFTPRLSAAGERETDLFRRRNTNLDHFQQCRRPSVAHTSGDTGGLTGPLFCVFQGPQGADGRAGQKVWTYLKQLILGQS